MDAAVVQSGMIKARFVGGPLHNRVREVPRKPFIDVCPLVVGDSELSPVQLASRHYMDRCRYKLTPFDTGSGAVFFQYVLVAEAEQLLSEELHA